MAIKRYNSLEAALLDFFETEFDELPGEIRKLLTEAAFFPEIWGDLSPYERRQVAKQWDYAHDPAYQKEVKSLSIINKEISSLAIEIKYSEPLNRPDFESKKKLEGKSGELEKLIRIRKRFYDLLSTEGEPIHEVEDGQECISYSDTISILKKKFNAAPEELAAWVVSGEDRLRACTKDGWILSPPKRLLFNPIVHRDNDYLNALAGCWFLKSEISSFVPKARYITGASLIERWGKAIGEQVEAFIVAKIEESSLDDLHPITGGTRAGDPDDSTLPPLKDALFVKAHIKQIESNERIELVSLDDANEFLTASVQKEETPEQRKQRLENLYAVEVESSGKRGALQRTATREGVARQTLREILDRKR
jgi:hypothetical protein